MAVFGVTRGSLKYLETLLECMQLPEGFITEDDDIQQAEDSHLDQLYQYLKLIVSQVNTQFEASGLKIKPRLFPDICNYPGLQVQLPAAVAVNTTTLNISVKKGALPVPALEKKETTTASPTKEKLKKSAKGTKSKKKSKLKPHQAAEDNLTGCLSKKLYLISLCQKID